MRQLALRAAVNRHWHEKRQCLSPASFFILEKAVKSIGNAVIPTFPMHRSYGFQHLRHKRPRLLSPVKVGIHSAFGEKSHTAAHTPKQGVFQMGVVSLPLDRSTRCGNPAWSGVRTACFGDFGSWSDVLQKNTESLRDSDALMRVAVPRRHGPAGLCDSVSALLIMW